MIVNGWKRHALVGGALLLTLATAAANAATVPGTDKVKPTKTSGTARVASLLPSPRFQVLAPVPVPRTTVPVTTTIPAATAPPLATTTLPPATLPPTTLAPTTTAAARPTGLAKPTGALDLTNGVFVTAPKGWTVRRDDEQRVSLSRGLTSVYFQVLGRDAGEDPTKVVEAYAEAVKDAEDVVALTSAVSISPWVGPVANVAYLLEYTSSTSGKNANGSVVLWVRADGLVLTIETSYNHAKGQSPAPPADALDAARSSWANAPLLNEPVPTEPSPIIPLRGTVDRVTVGDGLWIAVPEDWTPDVSDDLVVLKRKNAVILAAVDRDATSLDDAAQRYIDHLRELYVSMTFDAPTRYANGLGVRFRGRYDKSKNATVITGGFDVYQRTGHPYALSGATFGGAYTPADDPNIDLMVSSFLDSFIES